MWKWDSMSMDFVAGLPITQRKNNALWVIANRLTKTAHFIAMRNTWTSDQLARVYLEVIVQPHGVLDQDTRFQSGFWQKLQEAFGALLHFSIAFHLAKDG